MELKQINWGIIGTAKINNSIIPCINQLGYNIIGVATRNKNKRKKFFKKFKIKKIYKNYDSLVNDEKINFVYIPLPNSLHFKWCKKAIEKKKNVLCEKPICLESKKVKTLLNLSKKHKTIISEALMYRHNNLIKKLKYLIKKKVIGNILKIESNFCLFTKEDKKNIRFKKNLGGGSLYDLGYYSISLINFLFNIKPKIVFGKVLAKKNVDLKFYGEIHFSKKKIGTFYSSFVDKNDDSTKIIGDKGILIIPSTFLRGEKKIFVLKKNKKKTLYVNDYEHRYKKELKNIVRTASGHETLVVAMEESKKNVYCMEKLYKSSKISKYVKL